jgi:hypothetical protein
VSQIRYVVASLPRSGTKYISKVLTELGQNCGHERSFTCVSGQGDRYTTAQGICIREDAPEVWGDASWLSVPLISKLPAGTVVFHQLRDPLKVLNSNLPPGGDSYFRTWDENAGLETDPLYNKPIPYKRYVWENTRDWVWPGKIADGPETLEEIERVVHWWVNWNLWIEFSAMKRSDLVYVRYRLEDMSADLLQNIGNVIQPKVVPPRIEHCREILDKVSTTTNRHREPNDRITAEMLSPAARLLAYRYGYNNVV